MRRYPVLTLVLSLVVVFASYLSTRKILVKWVGESYYQLVERRGVLDHKGLIPAAGRRLFGLYRPEIPWDYARYRAIGRSLGVEPRIASFYQAWGDGAAYEFKSEAVRRALDDRNIPMITWEPWLTAFAEHRTGAAGELTEVARGKFDAYLRKYAREAVRMKQPFFLRPLHEVGNSEYPWSTACGNSPSLVAETYRHIVRVFRQEGAHNVAFVWTPHTNTDIEAWPGKEWVDWIGIDLFNYGTVVDQGKWQSFRSLVDERLQAFGSLGRPVMVAELGCSGHGGDCETFWTDTFQALAQGRYPQVQALVVFDHPAFAVGATKVVVDWGFSHEPGILKSASRYSVAAGFEPNRRP